MKKLYQIEQAERSVRKGTRCIVCGKLITDGELFYGGAVAYGGGNAYAHASCLMPWKYGHNWTNKIDGGVILTQHRQSPSGFIWAAEYETMKRFSREDALYLGARLGYHASEDATVTVEWLSRPFQTAHAAGKIIRALDVRVGGDYITADCGTHLNFSTSAMRNAGGMEKISNAHAALFDPLKRWLDNNPRESVRLFGSGWRHFASPSASKFSHTCWMAPHCSSDRRCVEFRLPRAVDADVYEENVLLVKEWTKVLDQFLDGARTASEAGSRILELTLQAAAGTAVFQKR